MRVLLVPIRKSQLWSVLRCWSVFRTGEGHGMVQSVALLSATLALGGCQSAGLGSNHQDIAPRWAGILFGITNACASIIGIGGIIGTGAVAEIQPDPQVSPSCNLQEQCQVDDI